MLQADIEIADMIWIQEAVVIFGKSRNWLRKQVDIGEVRSKQLIGSTRIYLSRSDIKRRLNETPKRRKAVS